MTQKTKRSLMAKLNDAFNASLIVENRKQLKELVVKVSEINIDLLADANLSVDNLPTEDMIDSLPEGALGQVVKEVTFAITDAEEKVDKM